MIKRLQRTFESPYFSSLSLFFLCLLATVPRFIGLFDNPWLDEIWSYAIVSRIDYPLQIFTIFHDNNHILNSLFIYFIGNHNPSAFYKYRILSFLCGVATIFIIYHLTKRLFPEKPTRYVATLLAALSFPLVVYSSEARGYGPAIFFAVLSLYSLSAYLEKRGLVALLCFNISVILGFLSHMTFLWVTAGLLAFFLSFSTRKSGFFKDVALQFLKCFLIPALVVSIVYTPFVSQMAHNFGPEFSYVTILNQAGSYLAGYSEDSSMCYPLMVAVYAILALEIFSSLKRRESFGFFLAAMILIPAIYLLIARPIYLGVRFFVCLYPFLLMALAHLSARLFIRSPVCKTCSIALICLVILGNTMHVISFLTYGRGSYAEAVRFMREKSSSNPITVASDNDFRNGLLLDFYGQMAPAGAKLLYIPSSYARAYASGPDWFIVHRYEKNPVYPQSFKVGNAVEYEMKRWFPYSGELSGFHWFVYGRK